MTDLSSTFNNRLGTHIIMESITSNITHSDSGFSSYFNRFYLLIISSLIASLLPVFTHKFTEFINSIKENFISKKNVFGILKKKIQLHYVILQLSLIMVEVMPQ